MPIDLDRILSLKEKPWPPFLYDLQGNIIKGNGRDHTVNIFFRFGPDRDRIISWLRYFSKKYITSAAQQFREIELYNQNGLPGGLFGGLYLSAEGYRALGVPSAKVPPDPSFLAGMKHNIPDLYDPPPETWDTGFAGEIDGMVLLADNEPSYLYRQAQIVIGQISRIGEVVQIEKGDVLRNNRGEGIEHFGYADGRSQPIMILEDLQREEFDLDGISVWNPAAFLSLALVPDPAGYPDTALGSYYVFRKLEQNVRLFKGTEHELGIALGYIGDEVERAGGQVVGRFEDGTPVVNQKEPGAESPVPNNFNYADDPFGFKCPFRSHIRKVNPRTEEAKKNRIVRRGIPYGEVSPTQKDLPALPTKDVGLLFACFQANIGNQFEYMQAALANNESAPKNPLDFKPGKDPVIGQGPATVEQQWRGPWGGQATPDNTKNFPTVFPFSQSVTLKGGEYFFAPSLSGLRNLS